jgi:hypothetical protein
MRFRFIVGLVAAASSAGVSAYVQNEQPIVIEGERVDRPDRRVCKTSTPPTGSRLGGRRICRAASEWAAAERAAEDAMHRQGAHADRMVAYRENEKNLLGKQGPP